MPFTPPWKAAVAALLALTMTLAGGCATPVISPEGRNTIILVPGIGGDGPVYAQSLYALRDHGSHDCLRVLDWGCGWPLFFVTISCGCLHRDAEQRLAGQIVQWQKDRPGSRVVLIGHSAGAGVVLGALARLKDSQVVATVILLAPALSPDFDLRPALNHAGVIHVFYSSEDFFWQGFGPTVFGNYDGSHREGAGRKGFTLATLTPSQRAKVIEHPYQKQWTNLGNGGGHFDSLDGRFVAAVLMPLIETGNAAPPLAR